MGCLVITDYIKVAVLIELDDLDRTGARLIINDVLGPSIITSNIILPSDNTYTMAGDDIGISIVSEIRGNDITN